MPFSGQIRNSAMSVNLKVLASVVFLLVMTAIFLAVRRKSQTADNSGPSPQQLQRHVGDLPFMTLPDGTAHVVIKPERIPTPYNGSDIYISLLTAPVYHESRFALQYVTWLQTVDPKHVRVITDSDENRWLQAFKKDGGTVVTPTCYLSKLVKSAEMMCCKTGAQFEQWYKAREAGMKYKWYCHVDDDLYLNMNTLVNTLKHYDPSNDCYLGSWSVVERHHKVQRIPPSHRLASKLSAYSERKRNDFRYANGPSYCISETLMMKVEKYLRGERFEENCKKSKVTMDDILPGVIIEGVLGVDITDTVEFKGQMDDIMLYPGNSPQNKEEITISFGGFVIKRGAFSHEQDPHGVLSYHCLRHPRVSWCHQDDRIHL